MINSLRETIERFKDMHELIQAEKTGTPAIFAKKINVAVRTIYYLINDMKESGAPVEFDRIRKTYYYTAKVKFVCEIGWVTRKK
jgi:predicted DNA-binding transcriptional regulator YafY